MKNKLFTIALFLAASLSALGAPVKISVQGTNVVLRWPSQSQQTFAIGYRAALDAANPWTILRTNYPANTSSNETIFVITNVVPMQSFSGGGGGSGGPPPAPNSTSFAGGDTTAGTEAVKRKPFEAPDFIYPPPLQKEPEKWAARSRSASAAASNDSGGANAVESLTVNSGFYVVSELDEDVDGDLLPTSFDLALGYNPFIRDTDGDGIDDSREDFDGDGINNGDEHLWGTDPALADDDFPTPLGDGLVLEGEEVITFTPDPTNTNTSIGNFLDANGNTANFMTATPDGPGRLKLSWTSVFVQYEGFFAAMAAGNDPADYVPTEAERQLRHQAFGEGTDFERVSQPKQELVDQMSEPFLDHNLEKASRGYRKSAQAIQRAVSGQYVPQMPLSRYISIHLHNMHTQATRMAACAGSLARRFGRAVARYTPFIGGILIVAGGPEFAQDFIAAARDYAHDIGNGDDETGSAAIVAGHCNDLAPGSGNLVLSYLLR